MTAHDTLTNAITLAIANGWDVFGHKDALKTWRVIQTAGWQPKLKLEVVVPSKYISVAIDSDDTWTLSYQTSEIIFSHSFAEHIWGTEDIDLGTLATLQVGSMRLHGCPAWKWHLQMMVVCPDPMGYLAEHLPGEAS